MLDLCIVCETNNSLPKDVVCHKCRQILDEEAPNVPLYNQDNLEIEVRELEKRIPQLFVGATCPLDFRNSETCSCTKRCKLLKVKTNKNSCS